MRAVHVVAGTSSEGQPSDAPSDHTARKTFTLVKDDLPNFRGRAALYRCDPPMSDDYGYGSDREVKTYEFVIASSASVLGEPETYLFGATADGEIAEWGELPGSSKGDVSHEDVFANAGYERA